jgi:hypothetical protein
MSTAAIAEWTDLLDTFERDLDITGSIVDHTAAPSTIETLSDWPSVTVSALPEPLRDRAVRILELQQERIAQLQEALEQVRHQLDQVRPRATAGRPEAASAYIDTRV